MQANCSSMMDPSRPVEAREQRWKILQEGKNKTGSIIFNNICRLILMLL